MKVLVIEDDAETAAYIVNGLHAHGHVADYAGNGREGLLLAGNGGYEVAIVDRMLPGLDGLSLVKTLRGKGVGTAVLFLTNLGGIDDRVEGLEAGGDDYLVKPFALPELLARVNALGRRPAMNAATSFAGWRSRNRSDQAQRRARRPSDRAAAARVQAAGMPDAQRRKGGHAHHAAGKGLGLPFRSQDQHRRNAYEPAARQGRPRLCQRAHSYGPRRRIFDSVRPARVFRTATFRLAALDVPAVRRFGRGSRRRRLSGDGGGAGKAAGRAHCRRNVDDASRCSGRAAWRGWRRR